MQRVKSLPEVYEYTDLDTVLPVYQHVVRCGIRDIGRFPHKYVPSSTYHSMCRTIRHF